MSSVRSLRCAIYTRKSSEEGLEQEFNSLHAQRDACAAFIASQRHEGWKPLPAHYEDGGYSGGSMERPALKQLLADIAAKRVDVVVVYKIDRLTRSLLDFAKMVEVFDKAGVSFVSVTQQFNTTSSMGRLTLNVLLSFAQFEREVTGERIRDKIAASKRKGMWMGGFVPLGYAAKDRTLVPVEAEADLVRRIFRLYLELGTVAALKDALDKDGLLTKTRAAKGRSGGGRPFSRGHLYRILTNPLYRGRIHHKGETFDGQHPALVDEEIWNAVQTLLRENRNGAKDRVRAKEPALLAGLLFDAKGESSPQPTQRRPASDIAITSRHRRCKYGAEGEQVIPVRRRSRNGAGQDRTMPTQRRGSRRRCVCPRPKSSAQSSTPSSHGLSTERGFPSGR